ncbi:MAG: RsmE family RNA methyltransferase [Planctomycetaceae bacterium]
MHWAFHEEIQGSARVTLEDSEAHHILHVLRMKSRDKLVLFDGKGCSVEAEVSHVTRRDVTCEITGVRTITIARLPRIRVAASPPKADRLRWMVEKLTELGVAEYIPLRTERTVVTPGETRLDKLRATVVSACKQCGRSILMEVQELTSLDTLLRLELQTAIVVAHPGEPTSWDAITRRVSKDVLLLIGPEGGFSPSEMQLLQSREIQTLSWPDTILRTETAAITFAAVLLNRLT